MKVKRGGGGKDALDLRRKRNGMMKKRERSKEGRRQREGREEGNIKAVKRNSGTPRK